MGFALWIIALVFADSRGYSPARGNAAKRQKDCQQSRLFPCEGKCRRATKGLRAVEDACPYLMQSIKSRIFACMESAVRLYVIKPKIYTLLRDDIRLW